MAEGKNSFILYTDLIHTVKQMPDDKAGELFKVILEYVNDDDPEPEDLLVKLTFEPIRQQLKKDLKIWEHKKLMRSKAGKASAKARQAKAKEQVLTHVQSVEPCSVPLNEKEQDGTKRTLSIRTSSNTSLSKKKKEKEIKFSEGVEQCFLLCLEYFDQDLKPKTKKDIFNWKDTIDKLYRLDMLSFDRIVQITEKARLNEFWNGQFLSLTKLRKKNGDGVKYYVVFDKLKALTNGGSKAKSGTSQQQRSDAQRSWSLKDS